MLGENPHHEGIVPKRQIAQFGDLWLTRFLPAGILPRDLPTVILA
jgi:hypothetical protein